MKKKLFLLSLFALSFICFAGCGNDEGNKNEVSKEEYELQYNAAIAESFLNTEYNYDFKYVYVETSEGKETTNPNSDNPIVVNIERGLNCDASFDADNRIFDETAEGNYNNHLVYFNQDGYPYTYSGGNKYFQNYSVEWNVEHRLDNFLSTDRIPDEARYYVDGNNFTIEAHTVIHNMMGETEYGTQDITQTLTITFNGDEITAVSVLVYSDYYNETSSYMPNTLCEGVIEYAVTFTKCNVELTVSQEILDAERVN